MAFLARALWQVMQLAFGAVAGAIVGSFVGVLIETAFSLLSVIFRLDSLSDGFRIMAFAFWFGLGGLAIGLYLAARNLKLKKMAMQTSKSSDMPLR